MKLFSLVPVLVDPQNVCSRWQIFSKYSQIVFRTSKNAKIHRKLKVKNHDSIIFFPKICSNASLQYLYQKKHSMLLYIYVKKSRKRSQFPNIWIILSVKILRLHLKTTGITTENC